jgi:hypothetical protein
MAVAVETGNLQLPRMTFMTEGNRLAVLRGHIRTPESIQEPTDSSRTGARRDKYDRHPFWFTSQAYGLINGTLVGSF